MRKLFFLTSLMLLGVISKIAAQDTDAYSGTDTTVAPETEPVVEAAPEEEFLEEELVPRRPTRNFIKMNLWNIPIRNYSFQLERVLTKRLSIAVGYRTMPEEGLPLIEQFKTISGMDESFPEDKEFLDQLRAVKVSNTAITPEIRLYIGKKGYGRGFYLAPFYRMATFNVNGYSQSYEAGNRLNTVSVSGKITSKSYGLMIGAQWKLARFISLDWWIVGGHVGNHSGEVIAQKDIAFTGDEKDLILENADSFSISNIKTSTPTFPTDNTVKVTTSGIWGGVRAGLCLGISF